MTLRTIALLIALASAAGAQPGALNQTDQNRGLPAGATANKDGSWSWTDAQGKQWVIRKTDMGYSRQPAAALHAGVPAGIPADATPEKDGSYTWTDKAGKKWTYRTTMMGVSRLPYMTAAGARTSSGASAVKVTDKGDTVRFERPGAFGPEVWEKKKTDLTAEEKKLYENGKANTQ